MSDENDDACVCVYVKTVKMRRGTKEGTTGVRVEDSITGEHGSY